MPRKIPVKQHQLLDLLNKQVKVKDHYNDNSEGPFILRGIDQGFVCLEIEGKTFWWSLKKIEGLREWKESDAITED